LKARLSASHGRVLLIEGTKYPMRPVAGTGAADQGADDGSHSTDLGAASASTWPIIAALPMRGQARRVSCRCPAGHGSVRFALKAVALRLLRLSRELRWSTGALRRRAAQVCHQPLCNRG
jgi:hypothetical protein